MTQLFIEPLDVWLFRDGRPFAAGSDHRAESLFPPFPTTTLGAIRRRELVNQGVNLWERDQAVIQPKAGRPVTFDAPADLNGLTLRGPFVTRREKDEKGDVVYVRYHPQPADARLENGKLLPVKKPSNFQPGVRAGMPASSLLPLGLGDDYEKEDEELLWLAESELKKYLKGDEPANGTKASDLFMTEDWIGIGMDNATYTVSTGALYEVQFIRPRKDVGLSLTMDGYDWSAIQQDWLQLGGESRAAMYNAIPDDPWPTQAGQALPQQFKVYLATPAYFEDGWQPKVPPQEDKASSPKGGRWDKFFGKGVELVSAAIGRYAAIGGFDLASDPNHSGAHRASRRFVPAGSVYYFKSNGANLLKDSLTDFGGEFGLGQILIEEW